MITRQPRVRSLVLIATAAVLIAGWQLFSYTGSHLLADLFAGPAGDIAWGWTQFLVAGVLVPLICCLAVWYLWPGRKVARWSGRELLELSSALVLAWMSLPLGSHPVLHHLVPSTGFVRAWAALLLLWSLAFPSAVIVLVAIWTVGRARASTTSRRDPFPVDRAP